MPTITVEHSQNAELTRPAQELLKDLHEKLASFPTVEMAAIKSRLVAHNNFRIAGGTDAAFVNVQLALMTGREVSLRQEMGKSLMQIASGYFRHQQSGKEVLVTLEVREMARETYFKTSVGVSDV